MIEIIDDILVYNLFEGFWIRMIIFDGYICSLVNVSLCIWVNVK